MSTPDISIVIPFYDEADIAAEVVDEMAATLATLGRSYEMLLIDDGSTDRTGEVLAAACGRWPHCRLLRHPRNAGQPAATWTGFRHARGANVVTLDGDGQNDPADLPELLRRLQDADMVVGVRARRRDSWLRRTMSKVANAVRQRCLRDGLSDAGCTLRVFRREVIDAFVPFATLYFMPAFAARAGFTVVEHPVRHRPRRTGKSKYGLRVMLWRPFVDMLAIGWLLRRRIPSVPVTERRPGDGRIETRNAADTEPMRTDGIIADSAERALRG